MNRYDALIIGGGLVGCATAWHLSQAGLSVALVERGQINEGASGRNAGSLHFQLEHRLVQHAQDLGAELEHYVALTRHAINDWRNIETELDSKLDLVMNGGLMLAESDQEVALLARKAKLESEQGLEVKLLDGDQARRLAPYLSDRVSAALLCPDEGHCNPRLLTPAYANKAAAAGADLFTGCKLLGLQRSQGKWQASCYDSIEGTVNIESEIVVNAAGAWAVDVGRMANLHLPIFPVALIMNVTERAPQLIKHLIQHVGRKLSMKQVEDGNLLIGGGWSARLAQQRGDWLPEDRAAVDAATLRDNLQTAAEVVPAVKQLHLLRTWTGTTGITPDQLPIIGEVSHTPGFYIAAGGSGFTYGPTYARLLCEQITRGEPSFPLAPYSPNRFSHMNMFMG